jgi:hypothetical protein
LLLIPLITVHKLERSDILEIFILTSKVCYFILNNTFLLPSLLSALQLRVSFGLLNNLPPFFSPSEADYVVSEQFSFYGMRSLGSRPSPDLEDQGIPLRLAPTP